MLTLPLLLNVVVIVVMNMAHKGQEEQLIFSLFSCAADWLGVRCKQIVSKIFEVYEGNLCRIFAKDFKAIDPVFLCNVGVVVMGLLWDSPFQK